MKAPRLRVFTAHVTGYQATHSLLRPVTPLAPEIVFQLSNIKVWWTDKCTVLFRPPFPDQMEGNKVYKMYLQRPDSLTMVEVPPNIWCKAQTIHGRAGPGGCQLRLSVQSHILLPTLDHEFPASRGQAIETC